MTCAILMVPPSLFWRACASNLFSRDGSSLKIAKRSTTSIKFSSPRREVSSASDKFFSLPNSNIYMIESLKLLKKPEYQEQLFVCVVFVMSIIVAFLFGYLVFRYEQLALCRTPIEVLPEINPGGKS